MNTQNPVVVPVALGERSYEIRIARALLSALAQAFEDVAPAARAAIVTDENVARHHLEGVEAGLRAADRHAGTIVLPAGEATKCFAELENVSRQLLGLGVERGDVVVALGGGVIGDLAGFAAAILRRGVRFIQAPTSLLAQVDSSVGGKTGINTPDGKNLIGAFHQPALVLIDTATLDTLPERELRAGYAEVVKYGLLGDADFFQWLEQNGQKLLAGDEALRRHAIRTSVEAKARVVAADEREGGVRALLNLGHTFGHALEVFGGYSSLLLHGEAISIGMAQAFRYSHRQGLIERQDVERVARHFQSVGLPTRVDGIAWPKPPNADELLALMAQDKKVERGRIALVLVNNIGNAFVTRDVDTDDLRAFLSAECTLGGSANAAQ